MAYVVIDGYQCDVCAWRWMKTRECDPERCPSCDTRQWNKTESGKPMQDRRPVPPVRAHERTVAASRQPARESVSDKVRMLEESLKQPRKIGKQCPHGYANWLTCAECNPRR